MTATILPPVPLYLLPILLHSAEEEGKRYRPCKHCFTWLRAYIKLPLPHGDCLKSTGRAAKGRMRAGVRWCAPHFTSGSRMPSRLNDSRYLSVRQNYVRICFSTLLTAFNTFITPAPLRTRTHHAARTFRSPMPCLCTLTWPACRGHACLPFCPLSPHLVLPHANPMACCLPFPSLPSSLPACSPPSCCYMQFLLTTYLLPTILLPMAHMSWTFMHACQKETPAPLTWLHARHGCFRLTALFSDVTPFPACNTGVRLRAIIPVWPRDHTIVAGQR